MEREVIKIELTDGKEAVIDMPRFVSVLDLQMLLNAVGALRKPAVSGNEVAYCKCDGANGCGFEPGENGRLKCAACGGFAI